MRKWLLCAVPVVFLLFLLSPLFLFASTSFTAFTASGEVKVLLNGKELRLEVNPKVVGDTVIVPMRDLFESLGAEVSWDDSAQMVTARRGETTVELVLGRKTAVKDGSTITLDVPPTTVEDRVMVPLGFVGEALGVAVKWDEATRTVSIDGEALPSVGSRENLRKLLMEAQESPYRMHGRLEAREALGLRSIESADRSVSGDVSGGGPAAVAPGAQANAPGVDSPAGANAPAGLGEGSASPTTDYSKTNVQVQGVDEADIVKTDGQYIYQVNDGRIVIVKAYPPDEMKVQTILKLDDRNVPVELYVDERFLVAIYSTRYGPIRILEKGTSGGGVTPGAGTPGGGVTPRIYPPVPAQNTVTAVIYDIKDKQNVKKIREVELEGHYVSSRKVGSALYLIANLYHHEIVLPERESLAPRYRDSVAGDEFVDVRYSDIRYFPGCVYQSYVMVAGLNLERDGEKARISTYLGAGEDVYASRDNLYVTASRYESHPWVIRPDVVAPESRYVPPTVKTMVYKFAMDDGRVRYAAKGEVPGTVLNQFSMDEFDGHFRVATTQGEIWRDDEYTSQNNIYVLDEDLDIVGRLEGIAPGERIYSVRFAGERGYVVTFKQVDPLFVVDLKNPCEPKILGKLKIPGYSDYLHPYDENHIIGFGKDTIELTQKDWNGNEIGSMAFYQGMKMAIFDVTDVEHPVEMFVEKIGDRGTDSELLRNHKALLFDRDRNLLAFPVTVAELKGAQAGGEKALAPRGVPSTGEFTFQGAYIYGIDLVNGFRLRGRITHLDESDYLKSGHGWYNSRKNVERILYIGDTLYTLSRAAVKAHDFDSLAERGSVPIPPPNATEG